MINGHDDEISFGKIIKIWKREDPEDFIIVTIQWYYKPQDIILTHPCKERGKYSKVIIRRIYEPNLYMTKSNFYHIKHILI
ncbi:unnamed protein product [Blepharisma stoltei]|uniref:BAH domain-containing protein n=1 Tax=Blepharisma stoltei TaxID=1481888 RepID=A0AAU9J060_9CILI|nr:unnamed protein product [Blepharisma stoltei]